MSAEKTATETVLSDITRRFAEGFPTESPAVRTVGREAEFPLVDAEGRAADASRLWPVLLEAPEIARIRDEKDDGSEFTIGVEDERWTCVIEVGRGTVEISVGPRETLHELSTDFDAALRVVGEAARSLDLSLLGYGVQPLSPASEDLLTPKRRYGAMLEAVGEPWLTFCVTAGDQTQIDLGRSEVVSKMNLLNALSGALVAFSANSPVHAGASRGFASARQSLAEDLTGEPNRHGAAPRRYQSLEDYVRFLAGLRCLCLPDSSGGYSFPKGAFSDSLRGFAGDSEAAYEAFLFHEHYIWGDARPRARIGTLEIRPACQQPADLSWTTSALSLGLVEAAEEIEDFLEDALGEDSWEKLARYRENAVRSGLSAPEPAPGFLRGILDLARSGLEGRGFGEERLLDPLEESLERRRSPADDVRRSFEVGGIPEIVSKYAVN